MTGSEVLQKNLQELNPLILSLFQEVSDIVICLTCDFRVMMLNKSARQYFRGTDEELLNRRYIDICSQSHRVSILPDNPASILESTFPIKITQLPDNSGESDFEIEWTISPIIQQGDTSAGFFLIGHIRMPLESTDLKETEEALRKAKEVAEAASREKLEFISNMSHDIRTPFTGLLGISKHLFLKEEDADKKEELGYVVEAAERLLDLFNEIIDLTKIETGESPVRYAKFNFHRVLANVGTIMHAAIEQQKLGFHINYDSSVPTMIVGDQLRVHRILLNLISNSVKFTEEGEVNVSVKLLRRKADKKEPILQIAIDDTGVGIPADKLEYVFEKFNKLTPSLHSTYPGTGLGLFIVKQFVDDLKGKITVTSKVGQGTTFICELPFYTQMTDAMNKARKADLRKPKATNFRNFKGQTKRYTVRESEKSIRFLLIEDEKMAQFIAEKFIQEMGHLVDVASTGEEAIKYLKKNQYDIILTDIGLPDIDGVQLAEKIRKELKITAPIIATTAHTPSEYIDKCKRAGINKIVMKPIVLEKLKEILAEFE